MKRTRLGGVAMMGLFLGCATASPQQTPSATAQGTQKSEAAAADAKQDPEDALICEEVPMTGSHIPRKICRTARQIKKEREQAQKAVREADRGNRTRSE
jgi:hypothetical protein